MVPCRLARQVAACCRKSRWDRRIAINCTSRPLLAVSDMMAAHTRGLRSRVGSQCEVKKHHAWELLDEAPSISGHLNFAHTKYTDQPSRVFVAGEPARGRLSSSFFLNEPPYCFPSRLQIISSTEHCVKALKVSRVDNYV